MKKSEFRITPPCPYFYKCGGCNLQHVDYNQQLKIKQNIVQTTLNKQIPFIKVQECEPSSQFMYRNKMQLPVTINGIGMYRENSHDIINIENCILCKDWIKYVISAVKEFISKTNISLYDEQSHKGVIRHILAREIDNSLSITIVINADELNHYKILIDLLKQYFNDFNLFCCVNKIKNNTILTSNIKCLHGNPVQETEDFGIKHFVSPLSFVQINRTIQNKIYSKILDYIDDDNIVIDAYSGAGLLTAIISKKAKYVYGIEIVKQATDNANELISNNNIKNVQNINGDCSIELPNLINKLKGSKIKIVLDPPRKGCSDNVLNAILESEPEEIIYVSCNPATLARDLSILAHKYEVISVKPYDMFPQTKHVETLAHLKLLKNI